MSKYLSFVAALTTMIGCTHTTPEPTIRFHQENKNVGILQCNTRHQCYEALRHYCAKPKITGTGHNEEHKFWLVYYCR